MRTQKRMRSANHIDRKHNARTSECKVIKLSTSLLYLPGFSIRSPSAINFWPASMGVLTALQPNKLISSSKSKTCLLLDKKIPFLVVPLQYPKEYINFPTSQVKLLHQKVLQHTKAYSVITCHYDIMCITTSKDSPNQTLPMKHRMTTSTHCFLCFYWLFKT